MAPRKKLELVPKKVLTAARIGGMIHPSGKGPGEGMEIMAPTERELVELQETVEAAIRAERTLEHALGSDGFDTDPEDDDWDNFAPVRDGV